MITRPCEINFTWARQLMSKEEKKSTWTWLLILTHVFFLGLWASKPPWKALMLHFLTNEDLQALLVHTSDPPQKMWTNATCFLSSSITQDIWQRTVLMNATWAPGPGSQLSPFLGSGPKWTLPEWCGYSRACWADVITGHPPFSSQSMELTPSPLG